MEVLSKIIPGVAIALLVALILYAFRVRQLYLLVPKMFGYGGLTGKGKIIELRAFNKGRSMEEEVHIDMPPALTYELIASDHPDIELEKNKVVLSRLSPMSELSMILLAEGSIEAESFTPTITSKTTKGKVVKRLEEVPPNIGTVLMWVGSFLVFMFALFYIPSLVSDYQKAKALERYAFLGKSGWRSIDRYVSSDARASYAGGEFPLVITAASRTGDVYEIVFTATNKTAAPLLVTAYFDLEKEEVVELRLDRVKSVFDVPVNPMQAIPVVVSTKLPSGMQRQKLFVRVGFQFGDEKLGKDHIVGLQFFPSANETANKALQQDAPKASRR